MKRSIIYIFLLVTVAESIAQDSTRNSIQLSWGIGNIMRQDLTVSPFIHKDWSPVNVRLNYERSKKLYHQVTLKFSLYSPKPTESYEFTSFYNGTSSTIPHSFKMIDIDYSIGKKWIIKKNWSFAAGGKSRNFIYASDYYFGESGPSPMMISFGMDVWGLIHYQLNSNHYLRSSISIPVFSYVYRNPYLTENDSYHHIFYSHKGIKEFGNRIAAGELRSWGNAQRVDLNIHYSYIINKKYDVGLCYYYSMNLNQQPTKFTQFENIFFLEGKIKF